MNYLKYVLHAAILIGLVIAAMRYLNSAEVWAALSEFHPFYGLLLLIVPVVQLALKGWRFEVLLRPFGVCDPSTVVRAYAAGQPATLIPGGIAARIGLLRQANVPLASATSAVLFSSLADQAVFIMGLLVLALAFPVVREAALLTLAGVGLVAVLLLVPRIRVTLGSVLLRLLARFGVADDAARFGEALRTSLSPRVVIVALALSLAALVSDVLLLDFSLRGVGEQVAPAHLFVAYLLPTMLGRLSALPAGGVGLAEAGITGYLAGVAGVPASTAVVAAATFRVSTIFLQALYGAFVYWFAWRGEHETVFAQAGD